MSTVSGKINLSILAREVLAAGISKGVIDREFTSLLDLSNGTADNSINKCYATRASGIGAATTMYDLIGTLTDEEGATINFDEVVLIAVRNLSTTAANYLTVGPDATNGFGIVASNKGFWAAALGSGGGSVCAADGDSWVVMHSKAGVPAAAGSTDELSIVTTGASLNTWDILILGRDNP